MSVDVLTYNELVKDVDYVRSVCVPAANAVYAALGNANGAANGAVSSFLTSSVKANNYGILATCSLYTCPWDCRSWAAVPTLPSVTCGFLICDAAGNFRCGSSCTWTVPAEAKFIRFQLWGAGAGTYGSMCCGSSMPGGSGAYASAIIPAVTGCQYTLCAGCARCCFNYCSLGSPGNQDGCASYVTGFGLNNFCADGGDSNAYNMMMRYGDCQAGIAGYCILTPPLITCSIVSRLSPYGYCMCSSGNLCWGNTCMGSGIYLPCVTSCKRHYGNVTNASRSCHYVVGMPGLFGCVCMSSSTYTALYFGAPPVFGCCLAGTQTFTVGGNCCTSSVSGSLMALSCIAGFGSGGHPSAACAGTFSCGSVGTMGAVCVQWTT